MPISATWSSQVDSARISSSARLTASRCSRTISPAGSSRSGRCACGCVKPIERCVVTTYDPDGGASDPRILRYVAQERKTWMGIYCDVVAHRHHPSRRRGAGGYSPMREADRGLGRGRGRVRPHVAARAARRRNHLRRVALNARLDARSATDRLAERLESDAAGAWSIFVPATRRLRRRATPTHTNSISQRKMRRTTRTGGRTDMQPATQRVTVYAYTPGSAPIPGDVFDGITGFGAESHPVSRPKRSAQRRLRRAFRRHGRHAGRLRFRMEQRARQRRQPPNARSTRSDGRRPHDPALQRDRADALHGRRRIYAAAGNAGAVERRRLERASLADCSRFRRSRCLPAGRSDIRHSKRRWFDRTAC